MPMLPSLRDSLSGNLRFMHRDAVLLATTVPSPCRHDWNDREVSGCKLRSAIEIGSRCAGASSDKGWHGTDKR